MEVVTYKEKTMHKHFGTLRNHEPNLLKEVKKRLKKAAKENKWDIKMFPPNQCIDPSFEIIVDPRHNVLAILMAEDLWVRMNVHEKDPWISVMLSPY